MAAWSDILEEARQSLGFAGRVVPRNLEGIRAALRPERLGDLDDELSSLSKGSEFEVFLDHWWTQAMSDSVPDADDKESAIEFADLAIALRVRTAGAPGYTQAQVEEMLRDVAS
ncbi:hypothetical protein OHS70_20375 [Streptomyces sp. NBC_00390]|uniref:hypothetical protein n=1 Tax=Streptomyces sp. NBC_00390 TaxID=2975736 RepID=UPI002E1AA9B7